MAERQDETFVHLQSLEVRTSSVAAVDIIVAQARQNPRSQLRWLSLLRQVRAWVYVPEMRYMIMASFVGFFILLGLIADPPVDPIPYDQHIQAYMDQQYAAVDVLDDVEFPEERWADDFLSDDI